LEKLEDPEEIQDLHQLIQNHVTYTQSAKGQAVLDAWETSVAQFVKVMPRDYKRVLQAIKKALESGLSGDDALNAAFEENAKDVARIGGS
jgi:glutamate synthase (ferredoxin)